MKSVVAHWTLSNVSLHHLITIHFNITSSSTKTLPLWPKSSPDSRVAVHSTVNQMQERPLEKQHQSLSPSWPRILLRYCHYIFLKGLLFELKASFMCHCHRTCISNQRHVNAGPQSTLTWSPVGIVTLSTNTSRMRNEQCELRNHLGNCCLQIQYHNQRSGTEMIFCAKLYGQWTYGVDWMINIADTLDDGWRSIQWQD